MFFLTNLVFFSGFPVVASTLQQGGVPFPPLQPRHHGPRAPARHLPEAHQALGHLLLSVEPCHAEPG